MDHYKPTLSTGFCFLNRRSHHFYLKETLKSNFLLSLQGESQIGFPLKFLQFDAVLCCIAMTSNAAWMISG